MPQSSLVLVNDRPLYRGGTGITVYLQQILRAWPADAPTQLRGLYTHALLHRDRWPEPNGSDTAASPLHLRPLAELPPPRRLARRVPHAIRRVAQTASGAAFATAARFGPYAAAWEPNNLATRTPRPTATTIHDLSVLDHPEWHPPDRVAQWYADLRRSLDATERLVTVSAFSRDRIVARLGFPAERVDVVPLAARPFPFPAPDAAPAAARALGLPERYFVCLGAFEPRKNLALLLDAWALLPTTFRRDHRLVLAGGIGWGVTAFWQSLVRHPAAPEVLTTGYLTDPQVAVVLAAAQALLMPSRYEGFGLPLLEAMAAGTAVACSSIPVFREVAEHAALLLDPADPAAWSAAIAGPLSDPATRARLTAAGSTRSANFTWTRTAEAHLRVFQSLSP